MYLLLSSCPNFFGKIKIQNSIRLPRIKRAIFENEMGSDQRLGSSKEKIINLINEIHKHLN